MNTNNLKKFASAARVKLINQVKAKLGFVREEDTSGLRGRTETLRKLQEERDRLGEEALVEKVAYTWFNRLVALRYLDANDFQPLGQKVVTPVAGAVSPQILEDAHAGQVDQALSINSQQVLDLLDGRLASQNADNEAYRLLLVGACNHLSSILPFLFEKINDYTELLLPDDLTSSFSIVNDVVNAMSDEDCSQVEIIGWLYQFYIAEKKDAVFAKKGKVSQDEIPAATQLFTPRWIVEYMVQNTLGKLWLQNHPDSGLRQHMPYFIESASVTATDYLKVESVEGLSLLDQACGSGHILVYAFELLSKIYEEQGYAQPEIPRLIIEKNLYGFEIDERAAQLAGFALMMKARQYHRRFFRRAVQPNISRLHDMALKVHGECGHSGTKRIRQKSPDFAGYLSYGYCIAEDIVEYWTEDHQDEDTGETVTIKRSKVHLKRGRQLHPQAAEMLAMHGEEPLLIYEDELKDSFRLCGLELHPMVYKDLLPMLQAGNLGSLILPKSPADWLSGALEKVTGALHTEGDVFLRHSLQKVQTALSQLCGLARKYHCVVDNPPYMGGGNMNKALADFVKAEYPKSKTDLMTCFMEAGLRALQPKGFLAMINLPSWLFLSSFENLRTSLIKDAHIDSLLHMGRGIFGIDWGSVAFVVNNHISRSTGFYFKLHKRNFQHIYPEDIRGIFLIVKSDKLARVDFDKYREGDEITELKGMIDPTGNRVFYESNQRDFLKIPGNPLGYWLSSIAIEKFEESNLGDFAEGKSGMSSCKSERFLRQWFETGNSNLFIDCESFDNLKEDDRAWFPYNKGGGNRKWYGYNDVIINWRNNGQELKSFVVNNPKDPKTTHWSRRLFNLDYFFQDGLTWSALSSSNFSMRTVPKGVIPGTGSKTLYGISEDDQIELFALLNSKVVSYYLSVFSPTLNFEAGDVAKVPVKLGLKSPELTLENVSMAQLEWNSRETALDFQQNELIRMQGQDLEEAYDLYCQYWHKKFFQLHKNEEALNQQFIEIYGLEAELKPEVPLEEITLLKEESKIENGALVFQPTEIMRQLVSYGIGCLLGRYSLDAPGLILANAGESLEAYLQKLQAGNSALQSLNDLSLVPDDDNIIPVLGEEWFEDDIVAAFHQFLKAAFGEAEFSRNLTFLEDGLGKDLRSYLVKDFYKDHIKRYKKRPIYWMLSSPKGHFNVLIYLHRYTPDTLNRVLNGYLREFIDKLEAHKLRLQHQLSTGGATEQGRARKAITKTDEMLADCREYEIEILFPLAGERIALDLDDGVLVNYNKLGEAVATVPGLNDKKAKDKVKGFDWIDGSQIR